MIPFHRPALVGRELEYVAQAMQNGQLAGDQAFTRKCHALLESLTGARRALLTTSCTHALEMAALLLDLKSGDEVIVPSFTFVSTVNAFVLRGARPIFADIRKDTLNLDESQLEALITPRTRAIVPVHYGGVGCEMDTILEIAGRHDIPVIEDNAHGLFGRYKGRPLGTLASMGTQSFHESKNLTCGEGGALLLRDEQYAERAEIIREKGTDRSRFFRGQVDKYTWVDMGSSYLLSDVLAAFLYGQLEERERIQSARKWIWDFYHLHLADWAAEQGVQAPFVPAHCEQAYHVYYLVLPSLEARQALMAHLKSCEIHTVFHYLPLHSSEMGKRFGGRLGDCPVTEAVSDGLLRLPMFFHLEQPLQARIIEAIRDFSMDRAAGRRGESAFLGQTRN